MITAGLLLVACLGLFRLDAYGLYADEHLHQGVRLHHGPTVLADHGLVDASNPIRWWPCRHRRDVADALADVDGLGEFAAPTGARTAVAFVTAAITEDSPPRPPSTCSSPSATPPARSRVRNALVGGGSAIYLDTKIASARDTVVIIPIVLLVVFLILVMLLRALTSPLILIGTVILSFGAALGISTLIFEYVFPLFVDRWPDSAQVDPGFPLFAFVFLVALGIDYNIFLMTRVREETMDRGTREGSLVALTSTGGVITSAGIVLAATFLVLGSLPLVFLAELGVAVALGVLLDTMIVRSVLVTAINLDLGGKIWWPSRLDRHAASADPDPEPERVNA